MILETEKYFDALAAWPSSGEHILAQYDKDGVWVYQAYRPEIAEYAVSNQKFSGCSYYKLGRMSWIKTNFLWMQYRSGWCVKEHQERCVAIKVKRSFFDRIVALAVDSHDKSAVMSESLVRLQWDPDHDPRGEKCVRRAIQLGLRGSILMEMASGEAVLEIADITKFVESQRENALDPSKWTDLLVPVERTYAVTPQS